MSKLILTSNKNSGIYSLYLIPILLAVCLWFVTGSLAYAQQDSDSSVAAGRVSMVIGKVFLFPGGSAEAKERVVVGTNVFPGDAVKTSGGGHVHIRFVDDALVSVRPNSQLSVDLYQYDEANKADSVIRFNLLEGRVRAISGKGAKAAKDKFRMNTPIAAIGVRGTDFVVSAHKDLVRAIVNEGAIVVSPFSEGCDINGVRRCDGNGVELRGDSQHILEFSTKLAEPKLVPIADKFVPELMEDDVVELEVHKEAAAETGGKDDSDENHAGKASVAESGDKSGEGLDEIIEDMSDISSESELLEGDPNDPRLVIETEIPNPDPEPAKPIITDYTPELAFTSDELNERQLVWGRWSGQVMATDRVVAAKAEIAGSRSITVGNGVMALYRSESDLTALQPGLGYVEFDMKDAQATLKTATSVDQMQVRGGWLNIDFAQGLFETGIELSHYLANNLSLETSGSINSNGYFNYRGDGGSLIGATTLDGKEASYYFITTNNLGTIEGVTFWTGK